jgi:hypothetical protein
VPGILLENPARDENVEMLIWRKNRGGMDSILIYIIDRIYRIIWIF